MNTAFVSRRISIAPSGCWLWTGKLNPDGYGRSLGGINAHRVVYELLVEPIPQGLHLDHLCRVRHCVNPGHLEPVTPAENTRRSNEALQRGDYATHCPQGHEYTSANTWAHPRRKQRNCRACNAASARRYRERKAASA